MFRLKKLNFIYALCVFSSCIAPTCKVVGKSYFDESILILFPNQTQVTLHVANLEDFVVSYYETDLDETLSAAKLRPVEFIIKRRDCEDKFETLYFDDSDIDLKKRFVAVLQHIDQEPREYPETRQQMFTSIFPPGNVKKVIPHESMVAFVQGEVDHQNPEVAEIISYHNLLFKPQ